MPLAPSAIRSSMEEDPCPFLFREQVHCFYSMYLLSQPLYNTRKPEHCFLAFPRLSSDRTHIRPLYCSKPSTIGRNFVVVVVVDQGKEDAYFLKFNIIICVCVVYVCAWLHVSLCLYVWGQRSVQASSSTAAHIIFSNILSLNLEPIILATQVGSANPWGSAGTCGSLPPLCAPVLSGYLNAGNPNSGPCACAPGTLPSHQPLVLVYFN